MTVDANKLRAAASAIETYNYVQHWIDEYGHLDIDASVSWHAAASCVGYKQTAHAVEVIIRNEFSKILRRALEHTELTARRACTEAGIEFDHD